jgi:hypothetical protein
VIHTKVARCAQLGFVEALCTSGDDQRPSEAIRGHQRPSEAIRGDQRRSEAIRGDQRRSEAIRSQQRPSEAIRGVVEGHQRGRRRPSEGLSRRRTAKRASSSGTRAPKKTRAE